MERVSIRSVDADDAGGDVARRALTDPLGADGLACNHYRVPPGEGLPGGLHAHPDQEEVFVVLAGEAAFERYVPTGDGEGSAESGEVAVEAGGAVRFPPGEFQSGRNAGDRDLVTLALGVPRDAGDTLLPVACPACGDPPLRLTTDDGPALACSDCGASHAPAPCPDCGDERLEATLGDDGRPVVACRGCAAAFDRPPVAGSE